MEEEQETLEIAQDVFLEEEASRSRPVSDDDKPKWVSFVSIGTLLMAMISAIGILMAGITLNEFFIDRTEESMENTLLGIDDLNIEVLKAKRDLFVLHDMELSEADQAELSRLEREQEELAVTVAEEDEMARAALLDHELFAIGVTLLTIAIALSAMATFTVRKLLWHMGIVLALCGTAFIAYAGWIWL